MDLKVYREYCLKFYLNIRHYIIIDGVRGNTHPHTWEFALYIRAGRTRFVEFSTYEKGIETYLDEFQNRILNDEKPFDDILPTLENVTDYFAEHFYRIIHTSDGALLRIEASETPTRSYILNLDAEQEFAMSTDEKEEKFLSDVIDGVLDDLL